MLKKLLVTAAAAAALSVPFAGAAWAEPPADPGSGNQGVPDRAAGFVESIAGPDALEGFESGNSTVVAPGTAYSTGAKVDGVNAPEGYATALNEYWESQGVPPSSIGGPFERVIPGSATKQFTRGCAQHSSGVCLG